MKVWPHLAVLFLLAAPGAATARPADDAVARVVLPAPSALPLAAVLRELDAILLAGEALPPDFVLGLAPMPPAERLMALAYARRAGLLSGAALPLADLLAEERP